MESQWSRNNRILNNFGPTSPPQISQAKIGFVVGSLAISGGTNLIIEYANGLSLAGADVALVYLLGDSSEAKWHPMASNIRTVPISDAEHEYFDLLIATWWPTVYELHRIKHGSVCYFVQSLETRFSIEHTDLKSEALTAATYSCGIPMITVSSWLQNLLMSVTKTPTWLVSNGIDKKRFPIASQTSRANEPSDRNLRILVEGFRGAAMKALDETVGAVRSSSSDIELWHVSPDSKGGSLFADRVFEQVPHDKMYEIYKEVDVLVKMSRVEGMFGPPIEAFHAGATAIVSKVTGYDEYIVPGVNSLVVEVDDFVGLTHTIDFLDQNRDTLEALKREALSTAVQWPSIHNSSTKFVKVCQSLLSALPMGRDFHPRLYDYKAKIEQTISNGHDPRELFPLFLVSSRL